MRSAAAEADIGPAADWLIDNYYVLEEQIREVRAAMPRGYYRELPELGNGALAGYPRVYELAVTLISHAEGRVDAANLELFFAAFQEVTPLTIGELWAVPAMLRLALIENVRRVGLRTVRRLELIEQADQLAERLEQAGAEGPRALGAALDSFVKAPPPLTPVFVARLLQQLRHARSSFPPLAQLEQWVNDQGMGAEDAAARATQQLALAQMMMAHSITSLRTVAHLDWRGFVERQSAMEAVLREDPSGFYARMTFASRDRYRHVVARIARRTGRGEAEVARFAVDLARSGRPPGSDVEREDRMAALRAHVGYYLVDDGLPALEQTAGYRPRTREALLRWVLHHPNHVFAGGILAATAGALAILLGLAGADALSAWPALLLLGLIPANDIAVHLVNQLATAFLPPQVLEKLDLVRSGIPPQYRTAVVVPTLFDSVEGVHSAFDHLEAQFLANRYRNVHFAVLSDFTDAAEATCEGDDAIVATASERVRVLNAQYGNGRQDAFYLFHRPRRFNPVEGVWMGWERKRGKLAEFNRFLRSGAEGAFSAVVGDVDTIRDVRFVITLDADTVLPPDAAPLLIGTLAHPLNRAVYDAEARRVVRGYGILQPRVGVSLPSAHRSRFAAIRSGDPGVDPYTVAVSDVYQDLYGEGSFTGKGIYEVDTFETATHGRFPENTLLSHDLIEGNYARAGLVTDILVYDDFPGHYLSYVRRKHRWIRGDWQLLRWLTARVPGPEGPEPNRLPLLSRWKILDNLRRSTVPLALFVFLLAGWTLLPGSPLRFTLLGLGALSAPWVIALLLALLRPPRRRSWWAYYVAVGRDAIMSAQQAALALLFLPHEAWISADAIGRTLWRLFVSRRSLLEWQSAQQVEHSLRGTPRESWRAMTPAVVAALAAAGLVAWAGLRGADTGSLWQTVLGVVPLVALWCAAPQVAYLLRAPLERPERRLSVDERGQVLRYALLHWRFFEHFATAKTHWLAPDNFQEDPAPQVAMRTSPTNLGLQLLSTVSAHDLGFITRADLIGRLEQTFRSWERMTRFRGHFYNWYDLETLEVLEPGYVSTVDSGNLAGHLLAFRQACLAYAADVAEPEPAAADDAELLRVCTAVDAAVALAAERLEVIVAEQRDPMASRALTNARKALRAARAAPGSADATAAPAGSADVLARAATELTAARTALLGTALSATQAEPAVEWIEWALQRIEAHRVEQATREAEAPSDVVRLEALAEQASRYVLEMDFRFLYDDKRELFSIGYQADAHTQDPSTYDLLASEARLASFVAIAKRDVPVDHWFRLGRPLSRAAGETALVSWSGSMFEYLMPALVMHAFPGTLLERTYRAAVQRHIAYGAERNVPWGISESAYNRRDRHLVYQYRAFGVPDLALKRGLGRDLVVAPYASALALLVEPERALANLALLETQGALGPYGFRDAIDYTRPDPGRAFAVVKNYMAHHIGMGLVALTSTLESQIWARRFHADPMVRSAELLLHERIPRKLVLQDAQVAQPDEALPNPEVERPAVHAFRQPDTPVPHVALLGRMPYTMMVTHAGAGYSRFEDLAVTRWRADGTRDATGQFCYVRDVAGERTWSVAHQPTCTPADEYQALLASDRVNFERRDGEIETRTEIAVVPEDAAEVRRVTVTNRSSVTREIELTSYGEIVLAPPEAERAHPTFANLFVETEWHEWCTAIGAVRRPRSPEEASVWCMHVVATGSERVGPVSYDTDRARFLGRGRTTRNPAAMAADGPLSGTTGAVLDPIFALRTRLRIEPGHSASVAFTTLVARTPERAFELAGRYHDPHAAQRALDLAWTTKQVELRELDLTPAAAASFQELASSLLYAHPEHRAPAEELERNRGSQLLLFANGVSGDVPIVVATIDSLEGLPTLRQLLLAHRYWRRRGLTVDLVVINERPMSYLRELHDSILEAIAMWSNSRIDQTGGVFVRRLQLLSAEELLMLRSTARLVLHCDGRAIKRIFDRLARDQRRSASAAAAAAAAAAEPATLEPPPVAAHGLSAARRLPAPTEVPPPSPTSVLLSRPEPPAASGLLLDNGYGGLTTDGDYQIRVRGDRVPPAPWVNVIANPHGGFIVSERGAGFTWAENSYFYRLTPWHNDPVSDPVTEALYLRDDETGAVWSATPAPAGGDIVFTVRHGAGRSVFESEHAEIAVRMTQGLAEGTAAKLTVLRLTNRSARPRRLTLTTYTEWTLGVQREETQHQVRTRFDPSLSAILAQNFFDPAFADRVAFHAVSETVIGHSGDRRAFLGRNGSVEAPAALRRATLAGTTGVGIDPCAALQWTLDLAAGESRDVAILLGAAEGEEQARDLISRFRDPAAAAAAIAKSVAAWNARLSVVTVKTPEPSFDAMLNRWALYQALACRMWGRSGLYQSSGAYGFRDQLQDVLAFVYAEPAIAREHLLRAAARQFVDGDVQHWWHPQSGRGVRTRISDDLVWLPYVVDEYIRITGDESVLDEHVPFLEMRNLEPHEHEIYDQPRISGERASLYEHCRRALRRAATRGKHGLPLIGGGDWNDGLNRVGSEGEGESVWLGWFLIATLRAFASQAERRGDTECAADFTARAEAYVAAVEAHGWDGEWYRRAYFDDGAPLGSTESDECRIDSIAQSWSVISGAGDPARQAQAMRSFEERLVNRDARVLSLLAPPFDRTPRDPGYIKGYLPGVRENGAQYTHAALWAVLATARLGHGNRAFELFQMVNPLTHAMTPDAVETYKTEPYVVAADVYTAPGLLGRGGWTWYTGSASWLYRVGLEALLGFTRRGNTLRIEPCVPDGWPEYSIEYRFGTALYTITVREPGRIRRVGAEVHVDGQRLDAPDIPLMDDGARRTIEIRPRE